MSSQNREINPSECIDTFSLSSGRKVRYYSLKRLEKLGLKEISRLPFSIRIILESLLRNMDGRAIKEEDVRILAEWNPKSPENRDIPLKVSRILMQDFTGVPAVVDLASMRDFVAKDGSDANAIQPVIPVDLIIDHSVQVDAFNVINALEINQKKEIERNHERYHLLKWAHYAFNGFKVFPPSAGICHQVNLEYLATCVSMIPGKDGYLAFPDVLVGTDSHTTMINGLGVIGFGVGGIEAEAAMLGEPIGFLTPKVLGVHLKGKLKSGVTATDFALTLTRKLRERGVVNMFVEFFGEGMDSLSLPDRATLSNMCPEYGATVAIFPVDNETLEYMRKTGRSKEQVELVKRYYTEQGMFGVDHQKLSYSDVMEVDLSTIESSVSGPSQPKQEVPLGKIGDSFRSAFTLSPGAGQGYEHHKLSASDYTRWSSESLAAENGRIKNAPKAGEIRTVRIRYENGQEVELSDGDVVISSITSCTNTSNPSVMIAAGLLARNAVARGLKVNKRKVKTSFGPGSRVVERYMEKAGLMVHLNKLGFDLVGYGCITCIGNSGPLIEKQSEEINSHGLAVAAVLSGNRNYEARIHPDIRANYLMSPPLVVAFAIAGSVLKDLTKEPLGTGKDGKEVYLHEIWPSEKEIRDVMAECVSESLFAKEYGKTIYDVNPFWNGMRVKREKMYDWNAESTYIAPPPFFNGLSKGRGDIKQIDNAMVIAVFGDSVSTDHISPAGAIAENSPAGIYLKSKGVSPTDFNTYGSRRGNHEVMMRGTFANKRIKNLMLGGAEGGATVHYPDGAQMSIYDAAMRYKKQNIPLVVFAGTEYGSGSSRDWAAKGPMLLGVKAVVAKSFERIHRSNLIGMGIIPLTFKNGEDAATLQIDYSKPVTIMLGSDIKPGSEVRMSFSRRDGRRAEASLKVRIDTDVEMDYYKDGGILNHVIKGLLKKRS